MMVLTDFQLAALQDFKEKIIKDLYAVLDNWNNKNFYAIDAMTLTRMECLNANVFAEGVRSIPYQTISGDTKATLGAEYRDNIYKTNNNKNTPFLDAMDRALVFTPLCAGEYMDNAGKITDRAITTSMASSISGINHIYDPKTPFVVRSTEVYDDLKKIADKQPVTVEDYETRFKTAILLAGMGSNLNALLYLYEQMSNSQAYNANSTTPALASHKIFTLRQIESSIMIELNMMGGNVSLLENNSQTSNNQDNNDFITKATELINNRSIDAVNYINTMFNQKKRFIKKLGKQWNYRGTMENAYKRTLELLVRDDLLSSYGATDIHTMPANKMVYIVASARARVMDLKYIDDSANQKYITDTVNELKNYMAVMELYLDNKNTISIGKDKEKISDINTNISNTLYEINNLCEQFPELSSTSAPIM